MRTPVGRIVPHDDGIADAELLQRYSLARDEVAFELLVRRHADTVWAACRSVIAHDTHAAEDAFQATFLTLARKAASIRTLNVAGWLHAVGVNTALKQLQQQRARPRPLVDDFAVVSPEPRHEESRILHEELAKLREPYRVAIVLCELNDYTHAEAAKQLGVPVGTLAARLSRGRAELKQRLERRGVALTILTTAMSSIGPASANVIRSTLAIGLGRMANPTVTILSEGVIATMYLAKLKLVATIAAGVLAVTGLTFVSVSAAPQGGDAKKGDAPKLPLAKPEDQRPLALIRTRALSTERLKRIMLAIHEYESVHTHFPSDICDANGKPLLSWRVAILPYLEQQALYQQFRLNEPWDSEHNKQFATVRVLQFNNSIEPRDEFAVTHFVRPTGAGTMHEPANLKQKLGIRSITDGVSNTLCVLEAEKAVIWSKPDDLTWDAKKPFDVRGAYANVIHLAMGDGSVRTLDGNLPAALATKLFSRGGGEITKDKEIVGTGWNPDRDLSKERAERFKAIQQTEREELTKELEQKSKELSELLQANLKKQEELLKSNLKRLSDPKSATVMIAHELLELNERLREQHLLKQRLNPDPVPIPKKPAMKQE